MRVRRAGWVVVALALAVGGADPGEAWAKPAGSKAAKRFDRMARKAYVKKRWDDAIAAFKLAYDADPKPKYLYNLGRCHEKMGDLPKAIEYLLRYVDEAPDAEDSADATATVEILKVKLRSSRSEVRIRTTPPGAILRIRSDDHKLNGTTPYRGWLEFGVYELSLSKDEHQAVERSLIVKPDEAVDLEVELPPAREPEPEKKPEPGKEPEPEKGAPEPEVAAQDKEAPAPAAPATGGGEEAASGGMNWPAWGALGAGAAALAGGGVFLVLSGQAVDERDSYKGQADVDFDKVQAAHDAAESRDLTAKVLLGAGGVAVAAGVVLLLLGGDGEEAVSGLRLLPGPAGAVVTWEGEL